MNKKFNGVGLKGSVYLGTLAMVAWGFGSIVPAITLAASPSTSLTSVTVTPENSPNTAGASVGYNVGLDYAAAPKTGESVQLTYPSALDLAGASSVTVSYAPGKGNTTGGSGTISSDSLTAVTSSTGVANLTLGSIPTSVTGAVYNFTVALSGVTNPVNTITYPGSDFSAEDPVAASSAVTSSDSVAVVGGPPASISVTKPQGISSGATIAPDTLVGPFTVNLADQYNNAATTTTDTTVSLSSESGLTYYGSASGTTAESSLVIPAGQSSGQFWIEASQLEPISFTVSSEGLTGSTTVDLSAGYAPTLSFSSSASESSTTIPVRQWVPFYVYSPAANGMGTTVALSTSDRGGSFFNLNPQSVSNAHQAPSENPVNSVYVGPGQSVPIYFNDPSSTPQSGVSISASDGDGSSNTLKLGLTAASGVQLVLEDWKSGAQAGLPTTFKIQLEDQYGNNTVAPSGGVPVQISAFTSEYSDVPANGITVSQSGEPANTVVIPEGSSSATFTVTGTVAGQYWLQASAPGYSAGGDSYDDDEVPLCIYPAPATQVTVTPLSSQQGQKSSFVKNGYIYTPGLLTLADQYGNPTYNGQTEVALSTSTPGGEFFADRSDCVDNSGQITQIALGSESNLYENQAVIWYGQPISATSAATLTATASDGGLKSVSVTLPEVFVSTTGSNSSGTGSYAAPYATINQALSLAPAGADVIVAAGTYTGTVTVTNQVNLVANGAVTLNASGSADGVVVSGDQSDFTVIDGFTIENAGYAGVDLAQGNQWTKLSDNSFVNDYFGVYDYEGDGITEGNTYSPDVVGTYYVPGEDFLPPAQALDVSLSPGWNTLSFPYVLSASSQSLVASLLASAEVSYSYQNGSWVQVTTANEASVLNTPMMGLYVELPQSAGSQWITLTPSTAQTPPPTISLQNGWNLVGPSSVSTSEVDTGFLSALSGLPTSDIAMIADPNSDDGNYHNTAVPNPLAPTTTQTLNVADGFAYWLYAQNLPTGSSSTLVGEIPTGNAGSSSTPGGENPMGNGY